MNELAALNKISKEINASPDDAIPELKKQELQTLCTISRKYFTLYEIASLLSSEIELDSLLRIAMDKVIEVTGAQRGFIAFLDNSGELDFKIARNFEKEDIKKPHFQVSLSIIKEVLNLGKTICLPDAMAHTTFAHKDSVMRLQLFSVLAAPINISDEIKGLIYVDNSDVKNLFDAHTGELLDAFSGQLSIALANASKFFELKQSHQHLLDELRGKYKFTGIIGASKKMADILQLVSDVAETDATILIQGENGTGKELIAKAVHYNSHRCDKPFITINCGAIPEALIESEFFGHVRGAFTGAVKDKRGKFELADKGTIFLDEIGEMKPALQVKLLRVLEDGSFSPVGSEEQKTCDVRVVAATNSDVKKMIADSTFREDLYYRLNVIEIPLPPLRYRKEDILLLVDHFIEKHNVHKKTPVLSKPAERLLIDFDYPGNIRQLENIIQRAVILCKGKTIETIHLPAEVLNQSMPCDTSNGKELSFQQRKKKFVEKFEKDELIRILTLSKGVQREASRIADMNIRNFFDMLKKHGIKAQDYK